MIGLLPLLRGDVAFGGQNPWRSYDDDRGRLTRRFGVVYQAGALRSSTTLAEDWSLPLGEFADLTSAQIREVASLKLALVGLAGFEDFYPSQVSGACNSARARALDPDILFLGEPFAGLDPMSARRLDDLILELRDSLGSTVVVVTQGLARISSISDDSVFLDRRRGP